MPEQSSTPEMSRHSCYGTIAGAYIPAIEGFFDSFLHSIKPLKPGTINEQTLKQFLISADLLAQKCCQSMAELLRESSNQKEIRETAEAVLQRLVRNRCFESLDTMLTEYAQLLLVIGVDLRTVHSQLGDSRLRDDLAPLFAAPGAAAEGASDPLAGARRIPPHKAKEAAATGILDYLKALENLPRDLLDYGVTKVFGGGEPDYETQSGFLFNIAESVREKHDEALAIVENLEAVKQKKWEDQRAADLFAIKEAARNSLMKTADRRTGFGSLIIGIICGLLDWGAFASGSTNQYVVVSAIGVGAIGIFFLYRGIMQLVRI